MTHLIHNNYQAHQYLTREEAQNLYQGLCKLGHKQINEAGYQMFHRSLTPLHKNWSSEEEFQITTHMFCKMSKELGEDEFVDAIMQTKVPGSIQFNSAEQKVLNNSKTYIKEACMLLGFIDSHSDFFEYEVKLIELGYPAAKTPKVG